VPAPGRSPATFPIPVFDEELASRLARRGISARTGGARRRILVLPDQLSLELGALKGVKPREAEIVLVESGEWLTRRPYHRQRLAWILLSQRTFALEAADAGFAVRVLRGDAPISTLLGDADLGSLVAMEPAEREVRVELAGLVADKRLRFHPGELDVDAIPASRVEIDRMWTWAKRACLPNFGPYEDAMSRRSRGVFHTRLSPLMNLHRLLPRTVVDEVAALDLPLQSKEGFIRQVLGWREFVYQVHRATDGFRHGRSADERPLPMPGDGGYARWAGKRWTPMQPAPAGVDGGARPNALRADLDLPPAWWGTESGLACLDHVVGDVWAEGWSHHITRLMVLANIATLLGVSPRELCDWFWIAYIDAWDWVVEPNVLAMGTYGDTGMTTKPYVSGSAYLEKMSDSCAQCRFTPGKDCPIGGLYWAFLARNEPVLRDNLRMKLPLASSRNRSDQARASDHAGFVAVRDVLIRGQPLGIPKLIDPAKTKQKGARP